jgi:hypothetical protein
MGNNQSQPPLNVKFIADFFNSLVAYKRILAKLSHNNVLSPVAIVHIEEALLLKQLTEWELFSYNILTYCTSLDTSQLSKTLNLALPPKLSFDNAQAILNGINFTSFSNIKELNGLANKILVKKYNPFAQFLRPMTKHVDEAIIIRNYIAHKSNSSKIKLMKVYKLYGIDGFIEPGEFIQTVRDFKINTFSFSSLCYVIFMTMVVFTWRILDKESYLIAFPTTKTPFDIGVTKMYIMFNHLSEFKDPESPINF